MFNAVIIFIVMKKIFSTSSLISKTKKDKAKIGLRSLGVLLAVTGVTWVLGIFSVNEDLVVFQYLFALFNSLQGLIMFVFHCLLNKQIRAAIAARNQRKVRVVKSTTDQKAASADDSKIRVKEVCMKHSAANPSSANVITTCDESDEPNARMEDFCTEQTNMTTRHSKWQTVWLQLQEFVKSTKDNTVYSNQENITEIDCGSEAQENLEN